jgi:hypothetical protein
MKEEIENYEENGKPIWNKNAIWDKIEDKIEPKESTVLLFPWIKFAAACSLLLMGLGWIVNQESNKGISALPMADNQTEMRFIKTTDTVFMNRTVQNNTIVNKIITKVDTIHTQANAYVVRDTIMITNEIYVTAPTRNDSLKTQKSKPSNSSKMQYAFIAPIGNYTPKTTTSFKIFNKEPLPKGDQVKQTFIVLK